MKVKLGRNYKMKLWISQMAIMFVYIEEAQPSDDTIQVTSERRQTHMVGRDNRMPTNVLMEAGEEAITLHWTPPAILDEVRFCVVEYKADNNPVSIRIPISKTLHMYTINGLNRNTLHRIRLCYWYDGFTGRFTKWFEASTRTASVEHSICPGSLPDAFLEPYCLKRPTDTHVLCEVIACKTGFRMSYILNVIYRRAMEPRSAYVMCANGTWVTQHEHNAFGVNDICLPEAEFRKCPLSIPNGSLERYCGPTTEWLCNFECNEGYRAHVYMSGILKNFFDDPDMLYCDNGIWKTGYEELGVDINGVCVPQEHNCTDSDDIPHGRVLHLPCPSGYVCGFKCDPGYHKHALSWDDPSCVNGVWALRTTKYDAAITPQNVCVPDDSIGDCPRHIQNGRIRDIACKRNCRPDCHEGYHVPERNPMSLSCEGGKWLTDEAPYDGDDICFPTRGHLCPYEIPNGLMPERFWRRRDDGESRRQVEVKCNDGYRLHRSMRWLECVAGEWVTGQERFGLNISNICIPYNPPS